MKARLRKLAPKPLLEIYREGRMALRALPYLGRRRQCPCCGWRLRRFLAAKAHPRPEARCPRCDSLERHRLVWLYLQRETALFAKPHRLLHVAPEYFFQRKLRALPHLWYESIDLDLAASLAGRRMDVTRLEYADGRFDAVLCSHVLEHVPDDRRAMSEFFRVLKPGGWALLQSPVDERRAETYEDPMITAPEERERHFGQSDHVRIYGRDYAERLRNAGFQVKVQSYAGQFSPELIDRCRLATDEKIYLCAKPGAA